MALLVGATAASAFDLEDQKALEAKIMEAMRDRNPERLVDDVPALLAAADDWDYTESELFTNRSGLIGMGHVVLALDAQKREDMEGFEKHVKEAFWHRPQDAQFLAGVVLNHQAEARLKSVTVPLDVELPDPSSETGTTTLGTILGDNDALLIDFWASWCTPCIVALPDLIKKADKLKSQGIIVVGINTENAKTAARFKQQYKIGFPWVVDTSEQTYGKMLSVDTIPRAVLIDREGKILYSGHPQSPDLVAALEKAGATL